jgi:predicted nucleic acid-binding protein
MTRRFIPDIRNTKVYIDANVLWNYGKECVDDVHCLNTLFAQAHLSSKLFTSTLAMAQAIAGIQKSSNKRNGLSKLDTLKVGRKLCQKIQILDFTKADLDTGFDMECSDIEDGIHYTISEKRNCNIIITNDTKGFSTFDIIAVKPSQISLLRHLLKIKQ